MVEKNIWLSSLEVYIRNRKWVLGYISMALGFALLENFIKINAGTSLAIGVMMSAFLAIPVHIVVLTRLDADQINVWLKERPNAFFTFVGRCLLLGLLGVILPIVVAIVLLVAGTHGSIALLGGLFVWIFAGIAAFAKWGTMLPAVITGDDHTLAAAGKRGSKVFGYAFPRLLISFALITVLFLAIVMLLSSLLGVDLKNPSLLSLMSTVLGAIVGAYQIVMTSVVLSRSYLRAQPSLPSARRIGLALDR